MGRMSRWNVTERRGSPLRLDRSGFADHTRAGGIKTVSRSLA